MVYDQPGGVAVRGAAAQDRCGQALQEGGQSDSGHMEDVDGGREKVPPAELMADVYLGAQYVDGVAIEAAAEKVAA